MKQLEILLLFLAFGLNWQNVYSLNYMESILSELNNFDLQTILHPPSFSDLASLYGHPAELHQVVTDDGYILTLFRLPGTRPGPPVLLFHGLLDSSDTWIIRGNTSLSITLANDNYDVWLGNVRGNRYSRHHKVLNPDVDPEFWNFSFDEHGMSDLPATIDYILNHTGAKNLNMFGHSQGNLIIYLLLSTRPEYNDKINVGTALAPICYLDYVAPPASYLVRLLPEIGKLLLKFGVTNVLGDNSLLTYAFRLVALIPDIGYLIDADGILFPLFGKDSTELEPSFLPTVTLHVPTWTSVKNLIHYGQVARSGVISRYDYGEDGNQKIYGSPKPPQYDLGKVTAKIVLLAALNDNLSQLPDVDHLKEQLANVVRYVINPRVQMNHIDYVWGRTVSYYLYPYIFSVLRDY